MGNHRDAWVFGGVDPSSGTACLMEIAKALAGKFAKGGCLDYFIIVNNLSST